jgi:hypothetical protein
MTFNIFLTHGEANLAKELKYGADVLCLTIILTLSVQVPHKKS